MCCNMLCCDTCFVDLSFGSNSWCNQWTSNSEKHLLQLRRGKRDLKRQSGTSNHGTPIACACVGRSGRVPGSPIASCGQHCVGSPESVDGAILHTEGNYTSAHALLVHYQVQCKVLNCKKNQRNDVLQVQSPTAQSGVEKLYVFRGFVRRKQSPDISFHLLEVAEKRRFEDSKAYSSLMLPHINWIYWSSIACFHVKVSSAYTTQRFVMACSWWGGRVHNF